MHPHKKSTCCGFKIHRVYWFFSFLFILCLAGGIVAWLCREHISKHQDHPQACLVNKSPADDFFIEGLHYEDLLDGKKIISIKADKFVIEKKRLAFFKLGFFNIARLENATITLYSNNNLSEKNLTERGQLFVDVPMKSLFKEGGLTSMVNKRIWSIIIKPICLKLNEGKSLVTQITASGATIKPEQSAIIFEGNVRVISGPKSLITDRLVLLSNNVVMKVDSHFNFMSAEEQWEGNGLTTDLFLRPVKVDQMEDPAVSAL